MPLSYAIDWSIEMARQYVEILLHYDATVNFQDQQGYTALMDAAFRFYLMML